MLSLHKVVLSCWMSNDNKRSWVIQWVIIYSFLYFLKKKSCVERDALYNNHCYQKHSTIIKHKFCICFLDISVEYFISTCSVLILPDSIAVQCLIFGPVQMTMSRGSKHRSIWTMDQSGTPSSAAMWQRSMGCWRSGARKPEFSH